MSIKFFEIFANVYRNLIYFEHSLTPFKVQLLFFRIPCLTLSAKQKTSSPVSMSMNFLGVLSKSNSVLVSTTWNKPPCAYCASSVAAHSVALPPARMKHICKNNNHRTAMYFFCNLVQKSRYRFFRGNWACNISSAFKPSCDGDHCLFRSIVLITVRKHTQAHRVLAVSLTDSLKLPKPERRIQFVLVKADYL
jgi:hypothetical protein